MLRIEFQIQPTTISPQLFDIEAQVERIEIDNALPVTGSEVFLFLTAQFISDVSEEDLSSQLSDIQIVDMDRAEVGQHMYYLGVIADLSDVNILSSLTETQAIPHRIVGKDTHTEVVASVYDWSHLKEVANTIEDEHGSIELIGTTQTEGIGFPLGNNIIKHNMIGKLSSEQLEVLEMAYQMGYFRVPQAVTAKEVANELDISRATLSERLHRIEHSICEILFGPQE